MTDPQPLAAALALANDLSHMRLFHGEVPFEAVYKAELTIRALYAALEAAQAEVVRLKAACDTWDTALEAARADLARMKPLWAAAVEWGKAEEAYQAGLEASEPPADDVALHIHVAHVRLLAAYRARPKEATTDGTK